MSEILTRHQETKVPIPPFCTLAQANFAARTPALPKAVLILVPGSNANGTMDVYEHRWEKFAMKNNVALVGCHFQDKVPSPIEGYIDVKAGSGDCLLTALERFQLGHLPILMWGFSAGGEFNYEFANWLAPKEPGRIAAFIVNKGGIYCSALAHEEARKIPAIFFIGDRDAAYRTAILNGIYTMNVACGAVWQDDHEPVGHMIGHSQWKSMDLFEAVLKDIK